MQGVSLELGAFDVRQRQTRQLETMYNFQLYIHLAAVKGRVTAVLAERTQFQIPAAALWQKRLTEARIWSADLVHFLACPPLPRRPKPMGSGVR